MKNKKRNSFLLVAVVAFALAAFSFVSPNQATVNTNNRVITASLDMHQVDFPADMTTAKCGTEGKKATKTTKKTSNAKCGEGKCGSKDTKAAKTTKKASNAKCGEGKCGSKDAKAAKMKKKGENAKCGVGKCGTKDAKSAKKAKAKKKTSAKCGEGKCGEGKGGLL